MDKKYIKLIMTVPLYLPGVALIVLGLWQTVFGKEGCAFIVFALPLLLFAWYVSYRVMFGPISPKEEEKNKDKVKL